MQTKQPRLALDRAGSAEDLGAPRGVCPLQDEIG
jgi:hypothetical protein